MRIAIIGPSGSGKTWLAAQLATSLGLRHVELDALYHGPNWQATEPDAFRRRVLDDTEGENWASDGTYHQMIGEVVLERADTLAWLDLPVPLVMTRLVRRTNSRKRHRTELWHGNVEGTWRESLHYLIWPAFKRAFENRRTVPALIERHPHLEVHRLRSDRDVRSFVQALGN